MGRFTGPSSLSSMAGSAVVTTTVGLVKLTIRDRRGKHNLSVLHYQGIFRL